ncbi:MAG: alpha/beta fold hydrolase, partial [Chloroflexi bacterium]|nr:alpha/beta fold hydrolase [Chloroflexota bacterium]
GAQPATPAPIPTVPGQNIAPAGAPNDSYPAPPGGMPPATPPSAYPAPSGDVSGGAQPADSDTRRVTFTTSDGVTLVGTYYAPTGTANPGLVLVHMVDGRRTDWNSLASFLQRQGYAVLSLDLRGHGESSGNREWGKMADDVTVAYRFLSGQPEVDPTRVALVGASIGANLALNVAASEPAVKSLVLLSPGMDYRGVKTEAAMKAYGARPVLFIASRTDTYAAQSVETLAKLAQGKKQVQTYENAGHGTQMIGNAEGLEDLILNWLRETLG